MRGVCGVVSRGGGITGEGFLVGFVIGYSLGLSLGLRVGISMGCVDLRMYVVYISLLLCVILYYAWYTYSCYYLGLYLFV